MKIQLARARQGILILSKEDAYLNALKNWEYRAKTDGKCKDMERFRTFLARQVLDWETLENKRLHEIIGRIDQKLSKLTHKIMGAGFPNEIFIIKTTGLDEWKSAYTRENAIVLPVNKLKNYNDEALEKLLIHEIFHVVSRYNDELRHSLYRRLGYEKVTIDWSLHKIYDQLLVNPDALDTSWALINTVSDKEVWTLPILFLREGRSDFEAQDIGDRIDFSLYTIDTQTGRGTIKDLEDVEAFYKRFGSYGFMGHHPEEVLAEAFVNFFFEEDKAIFTKAEWYEDFCLTISLGKGQSL